MSSGTRSHKFDVIGSTCKGTIESLELLQQTDFESGAPLFWDDAKTQAKMQLRIILATDERDGDDDDGRRSVWAKGQLQVAIRDAIKTAGADKIEEGGTLAVQYSADGEPPKRGMNAPKIYKAKYESPTATPAAVAVDDLF